jgi:methionine-gamma-lyase
VKSAKRRAKKPLSQPSLATRVALAGTATSKSFLGDDYPGLVLLGPAGEAPHGVPIFQGSNFSYPDAAAADAAASGDAFIYARHGNPTGAALEAAMANLEGAERALAFGSGMGALAAALEAAVHRDTDGPGERIELLASDGIYGGSTELVTEIARRCGARTRFVPAWETAVVAAAIGPKTRTLLIETLSNPLLRVPDIARLAQLCRARGVALVVDATATTPLLCRPLQLGANLVVHSLSKYVGGHGDLIGGLVAGDAALMARVHRQRTLGGAVLGPFAAWLALRGLRTLGVRLARQCENAARLARVLARHPNVRAVHHPSLASHPDRARARALFARGLAPGALISFSLKTPAAARRFYDRVQIIGRAASFGETNSLLTHPATFSHKGLSAAERARLGIDDSLLRLSVGLEAAADLEADVKQALGK